MFSRMSHRSMQMSDSGTAKKLKKAVAGNRKILHWSNQMLVGILLVPLLIWCVGMLVNTAALYYHTSRTVPFMTLLELAGIEGFIVLPLHIFGTIVGRQLSGNYEYPCRINAIPRPIPTKKMVRSTFNNRDSSRFITVRVNFHRDVLCVHFVLGIQDLLCLRLYVTGLFDSGDCDDLREYCLHLFLVEQ